MSCAVLLAQIDIVFPFSYLLASTPVCTHTSVALNFKEILVVVLATGSVYELVFVTKKYVFMFKKNNFILDG